MKFSILIPVYNVEPYIRECLDSVMNQTYTDYEVILVDDGSTDGSGMICDEYSRKYPGMVKVIHKENQGLISARREGIRHANGAFCVFVDSDDRVEPDLLETVADYLSRDDEIDIVLFSYRYLKDGVPAERYPPAFADQTEWTKENKKALFETLVFTNNITAIWTKAIRTCVLRSDPIDYTAYYHLNMAEDLLQSLHPILEARKVCYADRVLYNYRINTESISHSFKLEKVRKNSTLHVYHEILNCLLQWDLDTMDMREHLDAVWFHDAMYQFVRCYENADNRSVKKEVLTFDWNMMIPNSRLQGNQYVNRTYWKLYTWLEEKRFTAVRLFFWKKRIVKRSREVKNRLVRR